MNKKNFILNCLCVIVLNSCVSTKNHEIVLSQEQCTLPRKEYFYEQIPLAQDVALDVFCAQSLVEKEAPQGTLTIFGSARLKDTHPSYKEIERFAFLWTKEMGHRIPVLTGGGPGLMEAGNRGAYNAGGPSLYFTTSFIAGEKPNSFVTNGVHHSSFSQREAAMIDYAAAVVVGLGGVGTEWEIYETITKIQTRKKKPCPIVLLGNERMWKTVKKRLNALVDLKTISEHDAALVTYAHNPEEALTLIKKGLNKKELAVN